MTWQSSWTRLATSANPPLCWPPRICCQLVSTDILLTAWQLTMYHSPQQQVLLHWETGLQQSGLDNERKVDAAFACLHAQVLSITLSSIQTCEELKGQFVKYDYLWKQDLNQALQVRDELLQIHVLCACLLCAQLPGISGTYGCCQLWQRLPVGQQQRCTDRLFGRPGGFTAHLLCVLLNCILQDFLEANGTKHTDGTREDPPLAIFEEHIQKYK